MVAGLLGSMAGGAAVAVIGKFLRDRLPRRAFEPLEPPLSDQERRAFALWEAASGIPFLLATAAMTFVWYVAFQGLADLADPSTSRTRFLLRPGLVFWFLPAFFLGIVSAWVPLVILYRTLLGDRFPRYVRASNERHGFDGWHVFHWSTIMVVVAAIPAVVIGARTFARFDDDAIWIVRPLAVEAERHRYADVTAIEFRPTSVAANGSTNSRSYHIIRFADGSSLSTGGLRTPDPVHDAQLMDFVSDRSAQPLVEIP